MWRTLVLLGAFLTLARTAPTEVQQCIANQGFLPMITQVEDCVTPPCQFPQLQDAVINMVFRPPRFMQSMRTALTAYLRVTHPESDVTVTIPIPYNLGENSTTCNFLTNNATCPVEQGELVRYQLRVYVEEVFPVNSQLVMEVRVEDGLDLTPFLCVRLPFRIVAPNHGGGGAAFIDYK